MNIAIKLLDECKEKLNIKSNYALADKFDVYEQNISRYYKGESTPDDFMCFKIAETLELDAAYVIAQVRAAAEKNPKKADYFRTFIGTSRKVAASTALAVVLSFILAIGGLTSGNVKSTAVLFLRRRHFV